MSVVTKTQGLLFLTLITLFFSTANAAETDTSCFDFIVRADMARESNPKFQAERWCYQSNAVMGETFIFNADQRNIRPEQSMLIDRNGVLTHGSLLGGQMTIHKVNLKDFNPFSVPTERPNDKPQSAISTEDLDSLAASSEVVKKLFRSANTVVESFDNNSVTPLVSTSFLPWRGYWWPRKNATMNPSLTKYDRFVSSRENNPQAAAWERSFHAYNGVNWAGHCNGWAASAILRSEPNVPRSDTASGVTFSVSDQKALLAELDYCVSLAFFGNRNYGAGNNGDIRPELFHKTVLYYIGSLHKPVIMDYRSDAPVDNHIVSGYSMQIQQVSSNQKIVTATMTFHSYDKVASNIPGTAPRYTRVYKYYLNTDSNGSPTGGSWISGNPDFIWVPLSPARCSSNNQKLSSQWVNTILNM